MNHTRVAMQWRWADYDKRVALQADNQRDLLAHEMSLAHAAIRPGRARCYLGYIRLLIAIEYDYQPRERFKDFLSRIAGTEDCSVRLSKQYLCERQRVKLEETTS